VRTIRIYQPGNYSTGQTIELSPAASQHVGVVLRMQPGEELTLFTGDDHEFSATVLANQKKKVLVNIGAVNKVSRESPRAIHLAQAISKGERMEWVIQKAVELGVASITPLLTSRCVVRLDAVRLAKKQSQWQAIAIAACEQSGRNTVPMINQACTLDNYLPQVQGQLKLILHPDGARTWRDYSLDQGDIALLIGPEGGLSEDEINQAISMQFHPWRLGPRVLRTETAAITAIGVLQAICGDL